MPRESNLRDDVRVMITTLPGMVTNHEDKFQRGIGDTSFAFDIVTAKLPGFYAGRFFSGWFEFKHHHSWPKMWTTELKIGIRPEQRIWIRERWKHGRDVWIVVRICDDIYMFYGQWADDLYFPITRERFESLWVGKWNKKIDRQEFVEIICATKTNA